MPMAILPAGKHVAMAAELGFMHPLLIPRTHVINHTKYPVSV